ncbi:FAD-binding domain-containing protein [Pseudorhodobacter sp.]|uniref:FAD-binding domain-containing protein n=1 Tax=Pseudorhodobacter sp. TaxID=1934400 RepID=UPI0039E726A7
MNVLVWYKRDLRVEDHPALTDAVGMGAVLPVYIAEPDYWAQPDTSARQWGFIAETLAGLRRDLAGLGAPLVVRVGCAVEVLARLCRQNKITRIISHQGAANAWSVARDQRVAAWAREAGIEWLELSPRDEVLAAPQRVRMVAAIEPGVIPNARALRLRPDDCPHRQVGGRAQGLALLHSFLGQRGLGYRQAIASPLGTERACSRLSPYLTIGAISEAEMRQAVQDRLAAQPGAEWAANLRAFQGRIAWRAHFSQTLADAPQLEHCAMDAAAGALPGRMHEGARFEAWVAGQTGLPYLDACMRYLAATGWINFQARAMVTAVATYHLWLDWRAVGQVLARRLTDYDPGLHWPQIQRHAGMSGGGRMRVFDPVKEALAHDPGGSFTRRWVPELATVPDAFLQTPWKWPQAQTVLGQRYPEPVIDLAHAARAARAAMAGVRQATNLAQDRPELIEPLAAPASSPLFFDHRKASPRRARPAPAGQLCLDL